MMTDPISIYSFIPTVVVVVVVAVVVVVVVVGSGV